MIQTRDRDGRGRRHSHPEVGSYSKEAERFSSTDEVFGERIYGGNFEFDMLYYDDMSEGSVIPDHMFLEKTPGYEDEFFVHDFLNHSPDAARGIIKRDGAIAWRGQNHKKNFRGQRRKSEGSIFVWRKKGESFPKTNQSHPLEFSELDESHAFPSTTVASPGSQFLEPALQSMADEISKQFMDHFYEKLNSDFEGSQEILTKDTELIWNGDIIFGLEEYEKYKLAHKWDKVWVPNSFKAIHFTGWIHLTVLGVSLTAADEESCIDRDERVPATRFNHQFWLRQYKEKEHDFFLHHCRFDDIEKETIFLTRDALI